MCSVSSCVGRFPWSYARAHVCACIRVFFFFFLRGFTHIRLFLPSRSRLLCGLLLRIDAVQSEIEKQLRALCFRVPARAILWTPARINHAEGFISSPQPKINFRVCNRGSLLYISRGWWESAAECDVSFAFRGAQRRLLSRFSAANALHHSRG